MATKKTSTRKEIKLKAIPVETVTVRIEGDSDLILNRMSRRTKQDMLDKQSNRSKNTEPHNDWDDAATSLHWDREIGAVESEEDYTALFENGHPCISAFGLQKSLANTVSRFGLDAKGTEFMANVQIIAKDGLIPIEFAERSLDEKLIPSNTLQRTPVRSLQNRFSGWSANVKVRYVVTGKFSLEQILQVIGLSGFGIGIGSARSSGYGRYHIAEAWEGEIE